MKIKEMIEELKERESYEKFIEKYPNAFLCAGFFMLGSGGDSFQLNFFIENENKIASFEYPFASYKVYDEEIKNEKILDDLELKIDLDNLQNFIEEKLNKKYQKIIALIRENIWNITCLDILNIKRIKINAKTGEVIESSDEKLTDFIKIK